MKQIDEHYPIAKSEVCDGISIVSISFHAYITFTVSIYMSKVFAVFLTQNSPYLGCVHSVGSGHNLPIQPTHSPARECCVAHIFSP